MCIIDYRRHAVLRAQSLETTINRLQHRQHTQHLLFIGTEQHRRAIDRQQVIGIESTEEAHPQLASVDAQ